ncbi:MAG: hypothetical protein II286_01300, partial [Clostridia bacterium]|nr:hypothetical protein [Clostridia bacterium]
IISYHKTLQEQIEDKRGKLFDSIDFKETKDFTRELEDIYATLTSIIQLENVSFNNAIDIFAGIKAKGIENLSQEDYERLSENPYVFWEPTYLNTFGYESSQTDSGLDGYEDSFNSYEAYKSYNPYK